jgi:tetratricopeptide (TPR) repeat protein
MNQRQITLLIFAALLFVGLYFLMPTKPNKKKGEPDQTVQPLNDQSVLLEARKGLDSLQQKQLDSLEQLKAKAANVSEEVEQLKSLSRQWNEWGNFIVGGYYAQKVAELQPTGLAWSITGTTYAEGYQKNQDGQYKLFAARKALQAFEEAKKIEPDTVSHQINEALMYVELSSVDNTVPPMTGAQKLLAVDKAYPNNIRVNFALAQLSISRSGDYNKALQRLEKLIAIPNIDTLNLLDAHAMMLACYKALGDKEKTLAQYDKCTDLAAFDKNLQVEISAGKAQYLKTGK